MGYKFKASDGKTYETTGEFRSADHERFVSPANWRNETPVVDSGGTWAPVIIVKPVQPRYVVRVELDEATLENYRTATDLFGEGSVERAVFAAIRYGNYEEITD